MSREEHSARSVIEHAGALKLSDHVCDVSGGHAARLEIRADLSNRSNPESNVTTSQRPSVFRADWLVNTTRWS